MIEDTPPRKRAKLRQPEDDDRDNRRYDSGSESDFEPLDQGTYIDDEAEEGEEDELEEEDEEEEEEEEEEPLPSQSKRGTFCTFQRSES
jgi:hypothetical protein